jgi:anti-sigma-K factor RskA
MKGVSETTFDCNEVEELLPEYVLGTLDTDEVAEVARHLQRCPEHASALESYREVCDALGFSAPQIDPPAQLRRRLMASIASPARASARGRLAMRLGWVVAAVAALVAVVLGARAASLQDEIMQQAAARDRFTSFVTQTHTRMVVLNTTPEGGAAKGLLFVGDSEAMIWALGLPELSPGEVYHCWWFDAQKNRSSGGTFTTRGAAAVWWFIDIPADLKDLQNLSITREPAAGGDEPQGPGVLSGDL